VRRRILIVVAFAALALAGVATAGVLTGSITLRAGQCITVSKIHICAAHAATHTVTQAVPGPAATTVVAYTTVTAQPPAPAVAFTDGTYRVGVQIQPGTYQASAVQSDCYWARLRGFSGSLGDIIANSFAGATIVTIQPSDVGFLSERCGNWSKIG
jgi:hypothetical protein